MGDVRYKFVGGSGEYLLGVPAQDLTDDDYKALTDEQKDLLKLNLKADKPLYQRPEKEESKSKEKPKVTEE